MPASMPMSPSCSGGQCRAAIILEGSRLRHASRPGPRLRPGVPPVTHRDQGAGCPPSSRRVPRPNPAPEIPPRERASARLASAGSGHGPRSQALDQALDPGVA
jgi:hypothetical protein